MAIVSVIKYEGDNSTFVWKHPRTDFNIGSQLIVHESQEAVFMLNGEVLKVFGPGVHTLETQNLLAAKSILKMSTAGKSALHAECYFINLVELMAIKWGTDSKVQYLDPEFNFPIEIGASGHMNLAVSDSAKLLIKLVGTEKTLNKDTLTDYFRGFLMNRVKSIIPAVIEKNKIGIFQIDKYLTVMSDQIKAKLIEDFADYGIDLRAFFVTTIVKPDEDPSYIEFKDLYYKKYSEVIAAEIKQKVAIIESETATKRREIEGYTYHQEQNYEVAKGLAGNSAAGQTANLGVGIGMMAGMGGSIGQTVGTMINDAINSSSEADGKYCPMCGNKMSSQAVFCDKCGAKRG